MNQYLCEKNDTSIYNSTAFNFSQTLGDVSVYILPLLALVGNALILLIILTNPQLNRSSFSVYVKSMAVSDTFVLIFKFLSYMNKTSVFYFPSMCTVLIFCGEASVLLSVWTIVLITIERTLVVLFPLHIKKFVSVSRARSAIAIVAILTLIVSARVLIIPIDRSYGRRRRCYPQAAWLGYRKFDSTIITDLISCYIPLTIVVIGNCLTVCTVKQAVVRRHGMLTNNSYQQKRQLDSNENQLLVMLLFVTLMFIVYFVPFTITNVIYRWGLPFHLCFTRTALRTYFVIRALCELLKDLNFCTNIIIYCVSGRRFRYALFSLFERRSRQMSVSSRNYESNRHRTDYLLKDMREHRFPAISGRSTIEESQF